MSSRTPCLWVAGALTVALTFEATHPADLAHFNPHVPHEGPGAPQPTGRAALTFASSTTSNSLVSGPIAW